MYLRTANRPEHTLLVHNIKATESNFKANYDWKISFSCCILRSLRCRRNPLSEGEVTELAESTGLENRRRATYRGFESHPLRQIPSQAIEISILILGFFYVQFPQKY